MATIGDIRRASEFMEKIIQASKEAIDGDGYLKPCEPRKINLLEILRQAGDVGAILREIQETVEKTPLEALLPEVEE